MNNTKPSDILGMNARNQLYTCLNSKRAKNLCSSKYASKLLLQSRGIPTAKIVGIMVTIEDINTFDWLQLKENFVIKPTNGNAGKGVIVFKKKTADNEKWIDTMGKIWDLEDIKIHCYDILEGQYSTYGSHHTIIIEERIVSHPTLQKYSFKGTPDIRIIVFNSVPVMAMLRLPTKESEGRANVSQGAIAVGIDMATGITTYAVAHKNQSIKFLPKTKKKLNGIKIPHWESLLTMAVEASNSAELSFSGIDLFIDEKKGPVVVELNANPGLSIQNANKAGLWRRLKRVEDLNVLNPQHGVRISQALFAENFADKIIAKQGRVILNPIETISIYDEFNKLKKIQALCSTGRYRSAISHQLACDLSLIDEVDDPLWYQNIKKEGKVPVIEVCLNIKNKKIKTSMLVSKSLNKKKYSIILGRKDLAGFVIGVES